MKSFLPYLLFLFFGTTLLAQPANDNCADAISVMVDETVTFSTLGATTDGAVHTDCLGVNDSIGSDIWYTWTAPADGGYKWSNCGTADYDSRMAIYENPAACVPTDAELVACNDDGPTACSADFFTSEIDFFATGGAMYYLRLGGYGATVDSLSEMGGGTFIITVIDGPPNDFCANATAITVGTGQSFVTVDAIIDGPDHPGNSGCFGFGFITIEADIWYTFTPDYTGSAQWNTCGTINFDSRMAVYNPGSPCPPLDGDLYACNDDSGCPDYHSTLIFDVVEGETYLLRLGGFNANSGTGTFDLVSIIPPEPPMNDNCVDSEAAFVIGAVEAEAFDFGVFSGSTLNGTQENDFAFPPCLGNTSGGEFSDVWYHFNSLGNTSLEIRFLPITAESVFLIDLYALCGTQVDPIAVMGTCFSNEAGIAIRDTVIGLPAVDTEFLIRVTTRLTSESPGDFFFQIVGDNFISGTGDLVTVDFMTVSPNPVDDVAHVDFSLSESKPLAISMVNSIGEIVYHEFAHNYQAGPHRTEINMAGLSSGVYFITLNDGKSSKVEKVIKM